MPMNFDCGTAKEKVNYFLFQMSTQEKYILISDTAHDRNGTSAFYLQQYNRGI